MNKYTNMGMLLMPLIILIDRFIYTIPDAIAIILFLIAITLFLIGMIKYRKEKHI